MDDGTAYVLMQIHSQMCAFLYFNKNEIKFFLASFEKWVAYSTSVKTFDHFFYSNGMCLYLWVVWQDHSRPIESRCQDDGLKSQDSHGGMKAVLPHFFFFFFWVFLQMVVRYQIKCNIGCALLFGSFCSASGEAQFFRPFHCSL